MIISFCIDIISVLKGLSLMFQSIILLVCEVPQKIDERCAVIDALAVVPGNTMNRLKNLKVENGTVS